jgi:PIN domain nuclease of toxin-antitoxin system
MSKIFILDACALIALLNHENGADNVMAAYKISLADSIVLAQTIVTGGALLTADHHEFDLIEGKEPIHFHWIR